MSGRATSSKALQYVGVLTAGVAVFGYVVFGWEFGGSDSAIPFTLGAICMVIAIGWKFYERVY
jgi:hypothetical protein